MQEEEEEEDAGCHIGSQRPGIAYLAEIDLQRSHQEDERAVGEDDRHLRGNELGRHVQTLERRAQRALVVHAGRQFVPRAEQADQKQGKEDAGRTDVERKGQRPEAEEEQCLDDVNHRTEVPHPAHPGTHEGLQHPRHEEQGRKEGGLCRCQPQLEQHQQGHVCDHRRGNLLCRKERQEPESAGSNSFLR